MLNSRKGFLTILHSHAPLTKPPGCICLRHRGACAAFASSTQNFHFTKSEAVSLTLEVAKCKSWPQLEALFEEHKNELWHINIAALHTRISQVTWPTTKVAVLPPPEEAAALGHDQCHGGEDDGYEAASIYFEEVLQQPLYQVRPMEAREVEAFSAFYTRLAYATGRAMRRGMAAREICIIARAAARLGLCHAWLMDELREASLPHLQAVTKLALQAKPSSGSSQSLLEPGLTDLRQLAQLAYSFGKVSYVPEGSWIPSMLQASHAAMHQVVNSQPMQSFLVVPLNVANQDDEGLSSNAEQDLRPQANASLMQWREEVQKRLLGHQLGRQQGQHRQWQQQVATQQRHRHAFQQQRADSDEGSALMQSLANLVYGLVVLMGVRPGKEWMSHFYAASFPHLDIATGAELVQVVRALQVLSACEPRQQHPGQPHMQQRPPRRWKPKEQKVQSEVPLVWEGHEHLQPGELIAWEGKEHGHHHRQHQHQQQRQQQRWFKITGRYLDMRGVPRAWSAVLLKAMFRQVNKTPPGKFHVLLTELAGRVEASCKQVDADGSSD